MEMEWEERSLKSQMRRADKLSARFVLIVGEEEFKKGTGIMRNMDNKEQSEIPLDQVESNLTKRLTTIESERML